MTKAICLPLLLLLSHPGFSQICDREHSIVSTASIGADRNGPVQYLEAGLWRADKAISVFGGISASNGDAHLKTDARPLLIDPYIRFSVKLNKQRIGSFYNVVTAFGSARGDAGASYRLYYMIGACTMLGIEPAYSWKKKQSLSFIVTCAF